MAIALFAVWSAYPWLQIDGWQQPGWLDGDVPRWVAMAVLVAVYVLLALPLGAMRRATLYYANGGKLHGWADVWSGLLWMAVVGAILLAAWHLLPQAQEMLRYELHGPRVISL
jgi:hypothetical protein